MDFLRKARVFFKKDPVMNAHCEEFEVDNWLISEFILQKLVPIVGIRPFPLNEQQLLVSAVCRLQPTHIFEWGTHLGKSARIFYETVKHFRLQTEIHSIDLPGGIDHVEHPGRKRGLLVKNLSEVNLHQGDGVEKAMELYHSQSAEVRPLFFLDGDHSYETVRRELDTIIQNVPNASILIHDTFYQSEKSGYNIGPHVAVQETLAKTGDRLRKLSTNTGLPGLTLLYQLSRTEN